MRLPTVLSPTRPGTARAHPTRAWVIALLAVVAMVVASCSSSSGSTGTEAGDDTTSTTAATPDTDESIPAVPADRPYEVQVPSSYEESEPAPLLVVLHGYGATGAVQTAYLGLTETAEAEGMLLVAPDGTVNTEDEGKQFWNATEACCGGPDYSVDDSGYLRSVIAGVSTDYNVDADRIFLVGHSNGGFMSYRMACDHADVIAGIVTIAGATFDDPDDCTPSEPVAVLAVHGTADDTIEYDGGMNRGGPFPSAPQTVETWAGYNACDTSTEPETGDPRDVVTDAEPATVLTYTKGCAGNGTVELWTLPEGVHIPAFNASFSDQIVEFMLANPKG